MGSSALRLGSSRSGSLAMRTVAQIAHAITQFVRMVRSVRAADSGTAWDRGFVLLHGRRRYQLRSLIKSRQSAHVQMPTIRSGNGKQIIWKQHDREKRVVTFRGLACRIREMADFRS